MSTGIQMQIWLLFSLFQPKDHFCERKEDHKIATQTYMLYLFINEQEKQTIK